TDRFSLRGLAALPARRTRALGANSRHALRPAVVRGVSRSALTSSSTPVRCLVFMVSVSSCSGCRPSPPKTDQLFSDAVMLSVPCVALLGNPAAKATRILLVAPFFFPGAGVVEGRPPKGAYYFRFLAEACGQAGSTVAVGGEAEWRFDDRVGATG